MEEGIGFEPMNRVNGLLSSSQVPYLTRPTFLEVVGRVGIEPTGPKATGLQPAKLTTLLNLPMIGTQGESRTPTS